MDQLYLIDNLAMNMELPPEHSGESSGKMPPAQLREK
jgi:hypothetical protein